MDAQIATALFRACLEAGHLVGDEVAFLGELQTAIQEIPAPRIGRHGGIMEWLDDYEEADPGHRHISRLFALYPGEQIDPDKSQELADAAYKTLERRLAHGGGHTGWSRAWIINYYARSQRRRGSARATGAFAGFFHLSESAGLPPAFSNRR